MYTSQLRIAALAERFPQRAFTSLAHHIDAQWLKTAYLMTRRDGAVGIDGQTADDFARDFEANVQRLLEGLRYRLEVQQGVDLIGVASSGQELLELARELQPDVVVTDITMPGLSGLEACKILKKTCPDIRVLVLTMHDNEEYIRRAVACGAAGYVLKDASAEQMVFALREVASGRSHFGSGVSRVLLEEKPDRLTPRETAILKLMFEGMSSRDIGEALSISARTVESHRSNIYRKLNTNSLAGLFRYAMRHGLVELE